MRGHKSESETSFSRRFEPDRTGNRSPKAPSTRATSELKSRSSVLLMKPVRLCWGTDENPLEKQSGRIAHDAGSSKVRKNQKREQVSIVRRAPPTVSPSLGSSHPRRSIPSPSLFRSIKERRSPESSSWFRSSEEPHAGFTTVVLGCLA
jgi:hypothetical protein